MSLLEKEHICCKCKGKGCFDCTGGGVLYGPYDNTGDMVKDLKESTGGPMPDTICKICGKRHVQTTAVCG